MLLTLNIFYVIQRFFNITFSCNSKNNNRRNLKNFSITYTVIFNIIQYNFQNDLAYIKLHVGI